MPLGMGLPVLGTLVSAEVFGDADNHQVKVRLVRWQAIDG
jgi:hypothetical protein